LSAEVGLCGRDGTRMLANAAAVIGGDAVGRTADEGGVKGLSTFPIASVAHSRKRGVRILARESGTDPARGQPVMATLELDYTITYDDDLERKEREAQ